MKESIILIIIFFISCSKKEESQIAYLEKSASFIENNISYFDESQINILRIPNSGKEIVYEYRISNDPGFSIFEIRPQKKIIKNLANTQLVSLVLLKIDSLIKRDKFPILISVKQENMLLKFKIKDKIYTLIKGDNEFESKIISNNNFVELSNEWKMNEQEFHYR